MNRWLLLTLIALLGFCSGLEATPVDYQERGWVR